MELEGDKTMALTGSPWRAPMAPSPSLYCLSFVVEKVVLCGRDLSVSSMCWVVLRSRVGAEQVSMAPGPLACWVGATPGREARGVWCHFVVPSCSLYL